MQKLLQQSSQRFAKRIALSHPEGILTYQDLQLRATALQPEDSFNNKFISLEQRGGLSAIKARIARNQFNKEDVVILYKEMRTVLNDLTRPRHREQEYDRDRSR